MSLEMTSSEGFWTTKEGKSIPYTRESCQIIIDDDLGNDYYLQITKWRKNTTIEVSIVSGDVGADADKRWISERIYRLAKLHHAEFESRRDELIEKAIKLAYWNFTSYPPMTYQ